jgi:hypothetical protein
MQFTFDFRIHYSVYNGCELKVYHSCVVDGIGCLPEMTHISVIFPLCCYFHTISSLFICIKTKSSQNSKKNLPSIAKLKQIPNKNESFLWILTFSSGSWTAFIHKCKYFDSYELQWIIVKKKPFNKQIRSIIC